MCRKQPDGSYRYCPSVLNRRRAAGLPVGNANSEPAEVKKEYRSLRNGSVVENLVPLTPSASKLVSAIDEIPHANTRIVGGAVRDAMIEGNTIPKDVDIEVSGTNNLDEISQHLKQQGFKVDEVGKSFGVLTVNVKGESFDVSIPREDNKTGEGHRGFEVSTDRILIDEEATARRDFTINAMMWEPSTGKLIDPHNGLEDMKNKTLRHVSDAFDEDPLRVMRGIQFAGRFGYVLHPDTIEKCRSLKDAHDTLSRERIYGEWNKIFTKARKVSSSLEALKQTGWIEHYPELAAIDGMKQGEKWHPEGDVYTHSGLAADYMVAECDRLGIKGFEKERYVIGAMCHDLGKATHTQFHEDGRITSYGHDKAGSAPLGKFLDRIAAPKKYYSLIEPIVREHMCSIQKPTPKSVRKLATRLHPATIQQWALIVDADKAGRADASEYGTTKEWVKMAKEQGCLQGRQEPLVDGKMLIDLGVKPGEKFGSVVKDAYKAQVEGKFASKGEALNWAIREVSQKRNHLDFTDRSIIESHLSERQKQRFQQQKQQKQQTKKDS